MYFVNPDKQYIVLSVINRAHSRYVLHPRNTLQHPCYLAPTRYTAQDWPTGTVEKPLRDRFPSRTVVLFCLPRYFRWSSTYCEARNHRAILAMHREQRGV